jgi:hypothetical protein
MWIRVDGWILLGNCASTPTPPKSLTHLIKLTFFRSEVKILLNKLSIFTLSCVILGSFASSVEAFPKLGAVKSQQAPTPLVTAPVITVPSINVAPQVNTNIATNIVNQIGIAVGVGVPAVVVPQKVDLGNTQKIK